MPKRTHWSGHSLPRTNAATPHPGSKKSCSPTARHLCCGSAARIQHHDRGDAVPEAVTLTATDDCQNVVVQFTETLIPGSCDNEYTLERLWVLPTIVAMKQATCKWSKLKTTPRLCS